MQNKQETVKRLIIFIVLAFSLSNIPMFVILLLGVEAHSYLYQLVALVTMCGPAIASILTRVITREGFRDMYLRMNLKGNVKYYLLAVAMPLLYGIAGGVLCTLIYGGFLQNEVFEDMTLLFYGSYVLYIVGYSIALFFPAMGEELGWRAYMTPKMESLMGTPVALVVGGIIWGLWHISDIVYSCQGKELGYLVMQIVLKCMICIAMGAILSYFTKKTKSIYPASFLHMINNNVINMMYVPFVRNETVEQHGLAFTILTFIPILVLGIGAMVLLSVKPQKRIQG